MATLAEVWSRLQAVRSLHFVAHSEVETGWNGTGLGSVRVSEPQAGVVIFAESGIWQSPGQAEVRFTNTYRWSIIEDRIRLEHLRYGLNHPVFLFDLAPNPQGEWQAVSPHRCGEDQYAAWLSVEGQQLQVVWRIRGKCKQETLHYLYQSAES